MTKEVVHEVRIYCDGCGYAVVESTVDYIDRAFEQCGWLHTTTPHGAEMDYCPVCRADSPFEAVQRVRHIALTGALAAPVLTEHDKGYNEALSHVRRALDGADEDNQADFWDGDVPLGGDDMDGK